MCVSYITLPIPFAHKYDYPANEIRGASRNEESFIKKNKKIFFYRVGACAAIVLACAGQAPSNRNNFSPGVVRSIASAQQ